jgi:hypothetical protein
MLPLAGTSTPFCTEQKSYSSRLTKAQQGTLLESSQPILNPSDQVCFHRLLNLFYR